ncbi:uncharacterized protein LOC101455894 [Ceratitis capitata]|uniref:uncharacterized protein LOC101455894 n=1 Tax=Ceratitis capitata TaxID=7213 RepID=UPI000329F3FE|nr:uncharacterized protein LOC101455894 [Ceratitis capitata]
MLLFPAILFFTIFRMPRLINARFCEGGHYCSLPRECCTQGCCPPYQSGPRPLPPPSEHVLNLFFVSHWFFWCVVVAIILALLCAYSLWKKRRTLCGWGFPEHRAQSEGDSAGSCYAPPQYSRCNSFHHPPPPYTEVTSKPDLYPIVFTCNSDNAKSGSSYLMVQYFRNYIVRPSLSAASTLDSLSSSFICNINEANTLVPPPYSRAASPENGLSTHFQQQFLLPRSASQIVYATVGNGGNNIIETYENNGHINQQILQSQQSRSPHFTVVALNSSVGGNQNNVANITNSPMSYSTILQTSVGEQTNFIEESAEGNNNCTSSQNNNGDSNIISSDNKSTRSSECSNNADGGCVPKGFIQSQSEQQFRYFNNSLSDIFTNNTSVAPFTYTNDRDSKSVEIINFDNTMVNEQQVKRDTTVLTDNHWALEDFDNGQQTNTHPTQLVVERSVFKPTYKSCDSITSIPQGVSGDTSEQLVADIKDFNLLRQSLETCCHILQKKQHQPQTTISDTFMTNTKAYNRDELLNATASNNCSAVSSLANLCIESSPPQATSPTGEVREILDQIRQLQEDISYDDLLMHMKPALCHTLSAPKNTEIEQTTTQQKAHRNSVASCEIQLSSNAIFSANPIFSKTNVCIATSPLDKGNVTILKPKSHNKPRSYNDSDVLLKRPLALHQNKMKYFASKPNKALYIPMIPNAKSMHSSKCLAKSPVSNIVGTKFFSGRGGKMRRILVSRSAPTTPGTALPSNPLSDDSPLLTEPDEDSEISQNEHIE